MVSVIKMNQFKAHSALLETLISIIFHVESMFAPYAPKFIPVLFDLMTSSDWSTKKVSIDAIYSMTAIIKEQIIPYRIDILQALKPNRTHKMKPVREATLETIKLLKETDPPLEEHELAELDDNHQKSARPQPPRSSTALSGAGDRGLPKSATRL